MLDELLCTLIPNKFRLVNGSSVTIKKHTSEEAIVEFEDGCSKTYSLNGCIAADDVDEVWVRLISTKLFNVTGVKGMYGAITVSHELNHVGVNLCYKLAPINQDKHVVKLWLNGGYRSLVYVKENLVRYLTEQAANNEESKHDAHATAEHLFNCFIEAMKRYFKADYIVMFNEDETL